MTDLAFLPNPRHKVHEVLEAISMAQGEKRVGPGGEGGGGGA